MHEFHSNVNKVNKAVAKVGTIGDRLPLKGELTQKRSLQVRGGNLFSFPGLQLGYRSCLCRKLEVELLPFKILTFEYLSRNNVIWRGNLQAEDSRNYSIIQLGPLCTE